VLTYVSICQLTEACSCFDPANGQFAKFLLAVIFMVQTWSRNPQTWFAGESLIATQLCAVLKKELPFQTLIHDRESEGEMDGLIPQ